MKFKDIFKAIKPFASAAASLIPGGSAAIELINAVLPDDKKLPSTATGQNVIDKFNSLPPETQANMMEQNVKLEIALDEGWTERYKAMCVNDEQSTRPKIALIMAWMLAIPYVIIGLSIVYAVVIEAVRIEDMWPTLLAYLTVPLGILNKYFGELRKEHQQRSNVSIGVASQATSLIGKLFNR